MTQRRLDIIRALDLLDEFEPLADSLGLFGEEVLRDYQPEYAAVEHLRTELQRRLAGIETELSKHSQRIPSF